MTGPRGLSKAGLHTRMRSSARTTRACFALLAILACGAGALPATAGAIETVKIKTTFSPYKLGGATTIDVALNIADTSGGVPGPVTSFTVHLPRRLELVGSSLGLGICEPAALLARGLEGCTPNARLGSGSATVAVPFGPEVVRETARIDALMGPPVGDDVGVLIYADGRTPVTAQIVFPGVLVVDSDTLGESLNTIVPVTPTLPGAPNASMIDMHLSIGPNHLTYYKRVHGRKVGYKPTGVSLPERCPAGGFQFVTDFTFEDGTALKVPSKVPCPRSRRSRHHKA